jgi:excisionase family DNA binding protein
MSDTLTDAQLQQIGEYFGINAGGLTEDDLWIGPDILAEWLGVQKDWIYDQVAKDAIPHAKFGRQLRFNRGAIKLWIKERNG